MEEMERIQIVPNAAIITDPRIEEIGWYDCLVLHSMDGGKYCVKFTFVFNDCKLN